MTVHNVSASTSVQIPKAAPKNPEAATPPQPKPAAPKDSIQISATGQNALKQAVQEATETQAQTAQEARSGDLQAKKLLVKEEAAQAARQPKINSPIENLIK